MHIKMPKKSKRLLETVAITTLITGLIGGLTFAIMRSQLGEVQGNTISTTSASLMVSTDNVTYEQTIAGFVFDAIQPGGAPSPANGHTVYVKNVGSSPLSVSFGTNVDIENTDGVDLNGVHLILTAETGATQDMTLWDLTEAARADSYLSLVEPVRLWPGEYYPFKFRVTIEPDAVGSSQVVLRNLVFKFDGVALH